MVNYKSDDSALNDFLFCNEYFGERPSKIVLAFNFKAEEFVKYFGDSECFNVLTEVVPADGASIVNEKYLIKINDKDAFVSYTHIDKNVDTGYISNVIIYYKLPCEVGEILTEMDSFIDDGSALAEKSKINIISHSTTGLVLDEMDVMEADYENMRIYYNQSSIKGINKIIKKINKNNKGLFVLHGKRGCGKTIALNYIANTVSKMSIFIPNSMIDYTINNPEFIEILKTYNPLIIIDDCEILFDNMFVKSNVTYSNILQMVDGFYSDEINTHIILSYNTESEEDIDSDIMDANNLLKVVRMGPLEKDRANELARYLNIEHEIKNDILLIDLLKENFEEMDESVGYN
jgi:energy-coupling factor transporter ATP-binding protein EcfA2